MTTNQTALPAVLDSAREKWEITCQNLNEIAPLHDIWDRSNSDWSLENVILTMNGTTSLRKLRQISAEVEFRSMAMSEAKFSLLRKQAEITESQRRLVEETLTPFDRTILELSIAQSEEQTGMTLRKFHGAMKDVAALKRCYDNLVAQHGGVPTAEESEAEAHFSALVRALLQSLRDMRQGGTILNGNQEFLEQCGVNPSFAFVELMSFIEAEREHKYAGTAELTAFVHGLADKLVLMSRGSKNIRPETSI
jgi:hypothetical protein